MSAKSEMFLRIWETRKHVSAISGIPLVEPSNSFWSWQMAHILPRSTYPRWRLKEFNIILLTQVEHVFFEHFTEADKKKPLYLNYRIQWESLFAQRELMKEQYFRERKQIK